MTAALVIAVLVVVCALVWVAVQSSGSAPDTMPPAPSRPVFTGISRQPTDTATPTGNAMPVIRHRVVPTAPTGPIPRIRTGTAAGVGPVHTVAGGRMRGRTAANPNAICTVCNVRIGACEGHN